MALRGELAKPRQSLESESTHLGDSNRSKVAACVSTHECRLSSRERTQLLREHDVRL